ncbi:hypothetical protein SAMN02746041_02777 [Desulfacinum hydrothermale DSM 13146]|uniref:Uncharacterized protein n=1 Tax=Desulfacinum hydrothermale DSM 13146 TaxID=1121390 RepID=A0A1W1XS54_9BACT|nr:hypothetical protein [Desulfacinum hydrothermale]SMC26799.1 hypothetical protein SAMN02746041_02777 [Desulfacinum hydrothermale DSM 13146]
MPIPKTLVVFHYHLLRGGVRSALERSLTCLAQAGWASGRRLKILVGRDAGVRSFRQCLEGRWDSVQVHRVSALDYRDEPWPDEAAFRGHVKHLAARILDLAEGETLYWVHNPTLGKNAAVTAAWKAAAQEAQQASLPCRFLYHIHDFPECGRIQNLERLRRCWITGGVVDPYPEPSAVAYAVLNGADRARMERAGVPAGSLFFLPNLLELPAPLEPSREARERIAAALAAYADRQGYTFQEDRPWWLLPIRMIRRKNVLEAVLLAAAADPPAQVLITLDANSAQESPYAEAVKDWVRSRRYPVVIGFGLELVGSAFSMAELMGACHAVLTTSLLEGFGFGFLEGPLLGRSLLGRNLPDVTCDFQQAGFPSGALYEALPVPVEAAERQRLLAAGRAFAGRYGGLFPGLAEESEARFVSALEDLYRREAVDFGLLDLKGQIRVLDRWKEGALGKSVGQDLTQRLQPCRLDERARSALHELLGPEAHARRLIGAFEALFQDRPPLSSSGGRAAAGASLTIGLADLFLDPRYQRPLLGGWQ